MISVRRVVHLLAICTAVAFNLDRLQSPSACIHHDANRARRIGEASNPGPVVSHFDDPEAEDDWPETGEAGAPYDDGPPEEHGGWDAYGFEREQYSDSEASTAAPPEDGAGCIDDNVVPPWSVGLSEEADGSWQRAEDATGIKRSVAGWLKAKRVKAAKTKAAMLQKPDVANQLQSYECPKYAGSVQGYYYGTQDDVLGYHRLRGTPAARTISLQELLQQPEVQPTPDSPSPAKRRLRKENGARKRGLSKRWRAIRGEHLQRKILLHPAASDIAARPPAEAGLWTVDLANPSSFTTAADKVLKRSAADVVMLIETKKREADTEGAKNQAQQLGWRVSLSPAHATSITGTSGGTAVASRKGLGHIPCHNAIKEEYRHRIGAAWLGAVQKGGVHFVTVYLKDGEGISQTNQAILTELAAYLGTIRGPWIVGGDWNVTPQQLQSASWDSIVKGSIKQPAGPTCNGKVYDYFVVSKSIEASVVAVTSLENGGFSPHSAVRLFLSGAARHKAVRRLVKPKMIKAELPAGPLPRCENDFDPETPLAEGFTSWYTRARATLLSLTGESATNQQHAFRWEAATGKLAKKHPGASAASAILRTMVNRAREAATAHRRHGPVPAVTKLLAANLRDAEKNEIAEAGIAKTTLLAWCGFVDKAVRLDDAARVAVLANTIVVKAKKLEAADAAARSKGWRDALTRQQPSTCHTGHGNRLSRLAFRWVKGVAGWTSSTLDADRYDDAVPECAPGSKLDLDGNTPVTAPAAKPSESCGPASDQAQVEATAQGWAKLWNSDSVYLQPDLAEADNEVLQPLTGADIKLAASSFPSATGVGADAISPRAIARLPDQLLDELASLFMMAEDTGDWSAAISLVLIVLLPKDGGGFRPIGLFPTLIRVWMRARSTVARDYEELTASPELYGAKGMGAQRAAWTTTFSAEAAAADGQAYSAVLLDLVKAFELVDHRELALAAKRHGFSLKVLRLSLAAYRIARTLGIEEVYSGTVVANCGITAGSGFATTELRILLTDLLHDLRRLWPAPLKLYVDDLTIAAKGEPARVAEVLSHATDYAVDAFTKLGLKVSKSKSNAVASNVALRRAVVIKTRSKALRPVKHAKLLGVGLAGGKK